jgi:hypothetical protein
MATPATDRLNDTDCAALNSVLYGSAAQPAKTAPLMPLSWNQRLDTAVKQNTDRDEFISLSGVRASMKTRNAEKHLNRR